MRSVKLTLAKMTYRSLTLTKANARHGTSFSANISLTLALLNTPLICSLVQGSCMVTCFECDNDRSKIDDRSLNSPINRFRFGSRFSALMATNIMYP